jgi:serine/threonine-protein kinase
VAVNDELEALRRTLAAQGIAGASVSSTLGRGEGSIAVSGSAQPRRSLLPEALLGDQPDDEFLIRGILGRGGMATVWLAEQTSLARDVAIKRVADPEDPDAELLLLREAVITGQLEHPNIVPVHLLALDEDGPAVVMKRLSGKSWQELIHEGTATLDDHIDIALQVINALAFAHSRGILHRDVKPENVMIGEFGEVYLLDWGVARRASDPPSDAIVGTPRYMAPEMAEGHAEERTDVFLLGAALHEAVTGAPRHAGEDAVMVLYAAMYVEPYDYGALAPQELSAILNRACARELDARYPDTRALREALTGFREHRTAQKLTQRALERQRALEEALTAPGTAYAELQRLFSVARFGFEAALEAWPESEDARRGLTRCLCAMIDHELSIRHPDAAEALLGFLPQADPERALRVRAARDELEGEKQRLLAMERDQDPRVGEGSRTRAYMAMGGAMLVMTLALFVQRSASPSYQPSTLRLTLVAAFVLAVMIGIVVWWRRSAAFNFINRRIAEISVATLAVSFANRLSGVITHEDAASVLIGDALILGLGGAVLSAYHRAGPWLAGLCFTVAMLGSIFREWVDEMFIVLSVFVPTALFVLRRTRRLALSVDDEAEPQAE